ncbi:alginate lyase family protein, partial [Bacteroides sp. OttesenSCG-928-D19]|nr:alginate lyase family protein [Bacteroides sp. OttesenSCG-928-D19]
MKKICLPLFLLFWFFPETNAQWLWDVGIMHDVKKNIHHPEYTAAYENLIKEAEQQLGVKPYSVVYKEGMPPSGDKHDYVSLSRYVWPDPSKPDGLPYIHRDGESNPELEKYDRIPLGNMADAVHTLSLAYFFSEDEKYATKAVDFLKTWFLDNETRMNPHLEYAQFIPGVNQNKGRQYGLIDTYSFVEMLNGIQLMKDAESYTNEVEKGLQQWFSEFTGWWQTSEQGIAEKNGKNNHGLAYDIQLVTFALFSGNKEIAWKVIDEYPEARLYTQIEPDERQPQELRRTLAFHYSEYNIRHMVDMIAIAKSLGIVLYKAESKDGRSLYKAVDFLLPYLGKDVSEWP